MQIRQWELQSGASAAMDGVGDQEMQAIDLGFNFIEKAWREHKVPAQGFGQLHWIIRNVKDVNSPIYENGNFKWNTGLVEKTIGKLREEGNLAKTVVDCPYTIKLFSPWFVDEVLADLVSRAGFLYGCTPMKIISNTFCFFVQQLCFGGKFRSELFHFSFQLVERLCDTRGICIQNVLQHTTNWPQEWRIRASLQHRSPH